MPRRIAFRSTNQRKTLVVLQSETYPAKLKAYEKYKLPKELGAAQVNALTPLTFFPDGKTVTDCGVSVNGQCYGFVIVDSDIMVARGVLSLFFSVIKRQQMT